MIKKGLVKRITAMSACMAMLVTGVITGSDGRIQMAKAAENSYLVKDAVDMTNLDAFELDDVSVTDDYYLASQNSDITFLKKFDNDRLLAGFRKTAGVDTKGKSVYGGWEDSLLGGHCVGHYLSAVAQAVKATNDKELDKKLKDLISGLRECQTTLGTGFIFGAQVRDKSNVELQFDIAEKKAKGDTWVPWYNMHKMVAGLVDTYKYTKNEEALLVAKDLGDWIYNRVSGWSKDTNNQILWSEYGGMNDCLYDLYALTGNTNYRDAAHKFDDPSLYITITTTKTNTLNGRHANATIPKFVGALKRYMILKSKGELTSADEKYLSYAEKFWDRVINNYQYATGGVSVMEHFRGENKLDATRTKTNCESCCAHNMLKLSRELFRITGDKKYADYYESTLRNAIMGSVKAESGATTYFSPMATGYFKTFSNDDPAKNMFWCCTGTGMENFTKLGDSIYFKKDDMIVVNQYVSTKVEWEEAGISLTQKADVTKSDVSEITVKTNANKKAKIALRVPDWTCDKVSVKVNGEDVTGITGEENYIVLEKEWKNDDVISIKYPMHIDVCTLPDGENLYGFKYGPTLLAAKLGKEHMTEGTYAGVNLSAPLYKVVGDQSDKITIQYGDSKAAAPLSNETIGIRNNVQTADFIANINDYLVKDNTSDTLSFKLTGTDADTTFAEGLNFVPYNTLNDSRYGIYWYFTSKYEPTDTEKLLMAKEEGRLTASTIDSIQPGYSQYEKGLVQQNSVAGTIEDGGSTRYAEAGGFFQYRFNVEVASENAVLCQFSKEDVGKTIRVKVGDKVIGEKTLSYDGNAAFFSETFKVPTDVLMENVRLDGEHTILDIRFESADDKASARLVGAVYTAKAYSKNAELTKLTSSVGKVVNKDNEYKIYVPKDTTVATLSYAIADRFGLLYINDELVDENKDADYELKQDTTSLKIKVFAEDHETVKEYSVEIIKGEEPTGNNGGGNGDGNNNGSNNGKNNNVDTKKVKVGTTFVVGKGKKQLVYVVTASKKVAVKKCNVKATVISIPSSVSYKGTKFSVTEIKSKAFAKCKKLTKVTIAKSVTKLGKKIFDKCKKLKKVVYKSKTLKKKAKKLGYNF